VIAFAKSLRSSSNALFGEQIRHWRKLRIHHTRSTQQTTLLFFIIGERSLSERFQGLEPSVCDWIHETLGRLGGKRRKKHRREIVFNALWVSGTVHAFKPSAARPLLYFRAACKEHIPWPRVCARECTMHIHIMPVPKYSQRLNGALSTHALSKCRRSTPIRNILARGNAPIKQSTLT